MHRASFALRVASAPRVFALVACVLAVAPTAASAQTPVFSQTLRGRMTVTGNALGLDSSATTAGTPGTRGGIGTFIANPLEFGTLKDGSFPTGTTSDYTKNGSTAQLDLPAGVTIAHAELLWGCSSQVAGGAVLSTPDSVTLTLPSGVKQVISPQGSDTTLSLVSDAFHYYMRWANVTPSVSTGGAGRYMVSRVAGVPTSSAVTGCGWTLFVVYESDTLPLKNINLWVTAEEVRYNGVGCPCETQIEVDGFCTPPAPAAPTGTLFVTSMEGDARYTNDGLYVLDTFDEFYPMSGVNNAFDNFFSSQVNQLSGARDTRGTFGDRNHDVNPDDGQSFTLRDGARVGWDITAVPVNDDFENPDVLANSQSATSLLITSGGDVGVEGDDFVLGAVGLELEVASPFLDSIHDVDRTTTFAGDTITSSILVYNDGTGQADELFFCFAFPSNTTFTGDLAVDGTPRNGVTAQALLPQNCANETGGVSLGVVEAGDFREVTLSYRVDNIQAPPSAASAVTVTPSFYSRWRPDCAGAPQQADAQTGETRVIPGVSLDATLSVTPTTPPAVSAGATLTYTVVITNASGAAVNGATLRLPTPANTSFVAGSARVNGAAQAGNASPWQNSAALPTIPAGGQATVSFQVTVTATQGTTIAQTGYFDLDGGGAAPEKPTNTVYTQVAGQVIEPTDTDHDTIPDDQDNCVLTPNTDQANNYDASGYHPGAVDEGDACDDTDGDGILDGGADGEDPTGNGRQPNETDATRADTDGDGLCDGNKTIGACVGHEDADGDKDKNDWGRSETSPVDPDTDRDGVCDGSAAGGACQGGEIDNGTFPLQTDSDKDGLCDGPGGGAFDQSGCKGDETGGDGDYDLGSDTNPAKSDTDQDGLCDGFDNGASDCDGGEDKDGDRNPGDYDQPDDGETNPLDADTDDGGVKDGVEVLTQQTNPRDRCVGDLVNCQVDDDDGDGIPNDADLCTDRDGDNYGVGPNCLGPDCNDFVPECTTDCETDLNGGDGNGIPDCEENCEDGDGDGFGVGDACTGLDCNDGDPACTTDCSDFDGDGTPDCADSDDDDDNLPDSAEVTRGTDPRNPDTDGEGLLDGEEVNNYGTDPKNPDTDADGLSDNAEVKNHGTNPTNPDTDGEGLKDGEEVNIGTNPTQRDTDLGGVDDFTEVQHGTNPVNNPADDFGDGEYRGSSATGCAGGGATGGVLGLFGLAGLALVRRRARAAVGSPSGLLRAALAVGAIGALGVASMIGAGAARAAGPDGFSLNHFQLKPGADRIFSVEGTEVAPAWSPYGGLWFHYLSKPLVFVTGEGDAQTEEVVVESLMELQAGVGIGIADLLELELIAPITLSSSGDEARFSAIGEAGIGDLLARLRFEILGRKDGGDGFGLNLGVGVGIPSGNSEAGTGDGGVTILPKLSLSFAAGPVLIAGNVGANIRTDTGAFSNIDLGNELTYGLGLEVRVIEPLSIGMEVFGATQLDNFFAETAETPLELVGGIKTRFLEGLHFEVGGGTGLMPGYGAPEFRIFAGLQWAPWGGEPDTDGDGLVDKKDQCPLEPEDKDGFQDQDGCPDPDNDKDGVLDSADRCRDVPEDIDDFEDQDGCPDEDNDKDGLKDLADSCPDAAEDKDGWKDDDGCPDPDNDGDGIADVDDKCVDVPENKNEYQDDDGCPDEPPLARIEGCKIVIAEKVYFDTNKATIKAVSFPLLNEVARIIKENPGIQRVDIEGHTDADGSAAYNRGLSDKRAKSVRTYLIKQGIAANKLTGKGYGEDKPIADNTTPEGKEKNRRVEFMVRDANCGK